MEKVSNYVQLAKWNLRSLLNLPQPTVAPVIWRPSLMTSRHLPSPEFRNSLSEPENRRVSGILKELEILSKLSVRFPEKLTATDWKTLLELKSRKTRMDHLEYRFRKEKMAAEDVRKRAEAKRKSAERGREPRADHQLLLRFQSPETEKWQRFRRVVDSFRMGGPPILAVDCQFLTRLSPRGRGLTALQLQYLAATNREHTEPFRLFFVNYDRRDSKIRDLEQDKLKMLEDPGVFCPIVSASGLTDTFGREKEVIYLSPDASEELETVDDDKIYVIGGIVDRVVEHGIPKNASLEAAESAGVSARRLPIDRFVEFKSGSRFLTLLAVADILRQVNIHGDWRKALETTIPVRNLRGPGEKNQLGREVHRRIHEFNRQVLRRIEKQLGHEKRS